jgi:hypothetical protein
VREDAVAFGGGEGRDQGEGGDGEGIRGGHYGRRCCRRCCPRWFGTRSGCGILVCW